MRKILDYSRKTLHWLLSNSAVDSLEKGLQLSWQVTYSDNVPTLPFFADRDFRLFSEFARFWLRRFRTLGLVLEDSCELSDRGRRHVPVGPAHMPAFDPPHPILPYSLPLHNKIELGGREVKQRLSINDSSLVLISLLPPEVSFFFVLSYYLHDCMNSAFPLIKEGNSIFTIFMGDPTIRVLVPDVQRLRRQYEEYWGYLEGHIVDVDPQKLLEIMAFYILSIGEVTQVHICNGNTAVITKAGDRIVQLIDGEYTCESCHLEEDRYTDLVSIRHRINYSWQNGELSELFFSKLLMAELGHSCRVYPRIKVDGLPHESDVLVLRNDNEAQLFELKRCTSVDKWFRKGVRQLVENKRVLERWEIETTTYLVTNIDESVDIDGVDHHVGPDQLLDLASVI